MSRSGIPNEKLKQHRGMLKAIRGHIFLPAFVVTRGTTLICNLGDPWMRLNTFKTTSLTTDVPSIFSFEQMQPTSDHIPLAQQTSTLLPNKTHPVPNDKYKTRVQCTDNLGLLSACEWNSRGAGEQNCMRTRKPQIWDLVDHSPVLNEYR